MAKLGLANLKDMKMASRSLCVVSLVVVGWCFAPAARAEEPAKTYEVKATRDIAYYEGADADPVKHKLDLYLPRDAKDFPVFFFVHGGAWMHGDKNFLGIYSTLGQRLAAKGIGVVVTNYRLTPKVKHPDHIKDVARAFAWTHQNIAKHGGKPDQLFVCGHSAGGHLTALLATNEEYLKAEGLSLKAIKGAIPMSGIYQVSGGFFAGVFGKDAAQLKSASPQAHVAAGGPPFLIVYADKDMPACDRNSQAFCQALKERKGSAEVCEVKNRNHMSIIMNFSREQDPALDAVLAFITRCCAN